MCILGVALRMSCCLFSKIQMVARGCLFRPWRFLCQQYYIDFDFDIGFINKSLGVTWRYCIRNFKSSEIDCSTISQKKIHYLFELLKLKILLLYDYVKKYDSEDLKHLQMKYKNWALLKDTFFFKKNQYSKDLQSNDWALGKQRFSFRVQLLAMCRGEVSAVITRVISKFPWRGWKL